VTRIALFAAAAAIVAPPLPALPVVSRVRIDVAPGHVIITEDVRMARGDWSAGDLDLYVAFGAPGVPRAFDAHLLALREDAFFADANEQGEPVTAERQARRPARVRLLLGRESMAGVVVHLKERALRRAFAVSDAFILRLRSLVLVEGPTRDVVIRLGTDGSAPIAIGAIEVAADAKTVSRAEARLCGPNADTYPLALGFVPARPAPVVYPRPIAPFLAARHDGDDLCVRLLQ
jgi:hypothetical protein